MARTYPRNVPYEIRSASADDEPTITEIRRETWLTAYAQIIDPEIIDRITAPGTRASAAPRPDRTSLVAVAPEAAAAPADARVIVGYASYGPERSVASAASVGSGAGAAAKPGSLTPAGLAGETGELYTLYVAPAHWSTGAGRALTDAALDGLRAAGYQRVVLWTLTDNDRARRFYDKAGFAPDGAINVLDGLGNVEELRYVRDL
jgi:ribosomal protein S18 acetylase RimI-like enzyme